MTLIYPSAPLPAGDLTFLFTDIEGSTPAWEHSPDAMRQALAHHDRVVAAAVLDRSGVLIRHTGDGVHAVFTEPSPAIEAAVDIQRSIQSADLGIALKVRVGLHSGEVAPDELDYYGPVINRVARVAEAANGDQITVSETLKDRLDSPTAHLDEGGRETVGFVDCGLVELRGLGPERIYLVEAEGMRTDDRGLRSRRTLSGVGIPPQTARLIGRDEQVDELHSLVADRRLVSIIGIGGVGKTSLAATVARQAVDRFSGGVAYCQLASAGNDQAVAEVVAEVLGARRQPGLSLIESLRAFVAGRRILVVLDNCEHLIDGVTEVVSALLVDDGPTVLATSRIPIGVMGEQLYSLEPLDPATAGVEMIIERATSRDHRFQAEAAGDDLASICERLDGLPLAIELAAARLRDFSPTELLDQLDSQAATSAEALADVVNWSIRQLKPGEADVLAELSVFSGGFTLEAAERVCTPSESSIHDSVVYDALSTLVDHSLIRPVRGRGQMRYDMLETIRAHARARLDTYSDTAAVRARHSRFYAGLAESLAAQMASAAEADVWTRFDQEMANFRSAIDTGLDSASGEGCDAGEAAGIVASMGWFATHAMRMEIFSWARELIGDWAETGGPGSTDRARVLAVASVGAYLSADDEAAALGQASLEADPTDPTGLARVALAGIALNNTFIAEDSDRFTADLVAHSTDPMPSLAGTCLRCFHLSMQAPSVEVQALAGGALAEAEQIGSPSLLALAHWAVSLTNVGFDRGAVLAHWESGLTQARSLSDNHLVVHLINGLIVHFTSLVGPIPEAADLARREIRATLDHAYLVGASHLLGATAVVLARAGQVDRGAAMMSAMIGNGHRPRREIRAVVEEVSGDRFADYAQISQGWSIETAAHQALAWLDEIS